MVGRPSEPIEKLAMNGNPGQRRLPRETFAVAEPAFVVGYLKGAARTLAKKMIAASPWLRATDSYALAMWCDEMSDFLANHTDTKRWNKGRLTQLKKQTMQMGFTPSARAAMARGIEHVYQLKEELLGINRPGRIGKKQAVDADAQPAKKDDEYFH
jgi:hypothetical protein